MLGTSADWVRRVVVGGSAAVFATVLSVAIGQAGSRLHPAAFWLLPLMAVGSIETFVVSQRRNWVQDPTVEPIRAALKEVLEGGTFRATLADSEIEKIAASFESVPRCVQSIAVEAPEVQASQAFQPINLPVRAAEVPDYWDSGSAPTSSPASASTSTSASASTSGAEVDPFDF